MSNVIDHIDLQTHDEFCQLRFSDLEKFSDASGYTCKLTIRSGEFACIDRQFFFDDSHFPDAMRSLKQMDEGETAKAIIKGQWETDYISFESDEMGHVFVRGELQEHSKLSQTLKFAFATDQTVIGPLIRDLLPLIQT